ncbi:MAG: preprotein translocase subunit SecE [Candidatus Portnoybacteria bacterium CG_4_8_14_3_um_filter_44_15]|jgi:preprotein translocase subunit SecE|uniref:Protein translocase subunit SecE n=4 Tax=Candidatus Portnoyibacteriota TaxID=1817913 RepID=A0A2M7YMD5_9BACT|nr:MAG: preprotein translocase subunit SecE [Candidatus Portnoybacteria bacterium CG23_combo_of_CG06-09_8_20_14_all_44_36]PIW74907.1 MAG: preprotein translocase subunit SecE [Candidatus Portnoybacteria bacterium CG_4_8_14_3_um_filter_44_15]PIZ70089.1 MAG: preprotein translocase subunit SecE [Candidatus Portnoybacteria bacterium CG_4_10_14_0_2_um_filter_43_36]PJA64127.1 MAG: preprotein translocase subunit SecE [Candidatus Portnoybacteria bacterium CG_4_9_14_3_um_filter_43_11]PJE59394.1 MAG: prep
MPVSQLPQKGIEFLKEVRLELKRVTWPTKKEAIKLTLIVIGFGLTVAAFLGGLDFLFSYLLDRFVI